MGRSGCVFPPCLIPVICVKYIPCERNDYPLDMDNGDDGSFP